MRSLILGLTFICVSASSGEFKSPQAQKLADQLVQAINQKVAEIAALEIAAGVAPKDVKINLSQQERYDSGRFGAIIDAKNTGKIISVTPRGQASQLGLRSGDVILAVNNQPLNTSNKAWLSALQYADDNTEIALKVRRNSQELLLSGTFKAKYIPEWQFISSKELLLQGKLKARFIPEWSLNISAPVMPEKVVRRNESNIPPDSCGRIIVSGNASAPNPFNGIQSIAVIKAIDDERVMRERTRIKVSPGDHRFKISSAFEKNEEPNEYSLYVEPDKNYYMIYAKSVDWRDESGNLLDEKSYTGPIIWKISQQECEM